MLGSIHRDKKSVNKVKGDCNLAKHVNGKAAEGNVSFLEYIYLCLHVLQSSWQSLESSQHAGTFDSTRFNKGTQVKLDV